MRVIETKVYQFKELSDEAKEKALEWGTCLNVDHDWWEFIYEDAAQVGIKLTEFDIDRGSYCKGELMEGAPEVARKLVENHGEKCATYMTAKTFLYEYDKLVEKHSDGKQKDRVSEDNEYEFDQDAEELEEEFVKNICGDYLKMLRNEYEYRSSEEAIIETIEANEYEFEEDGSRF